ncbi:MAG: tyrosine--tRNA ligase [Phycisphaerae bacterium]|nr:tyrosine--tRNA ligase [Phycisphaerae bacterium]
MGVSIDEAIRRLTRGCDAIYTERELAERLESARKARRPLRVKLGMDPTAPDIHLGHTVVLRKMRQFQDLGHVAVLIIGDFTARIGDPSGRSKTRPVLTPDEVEFNAKTYLSQAGKILDTSPGKLEVRHNSEWLASMTFADVLKLAGQMTVGQMLKREDFRKRFEGETPIGVHELMYPLMQGWDSVCIRSDVELGGTDQTFNNLVGRDLQIAQGQPPQIVMVMPLLVGLDGAQKMSKSYGNYVAVNETAQDMFGKIMSIPDDLMRGYYTLLSDEPAECVEEWCDPARTHPREAKVRLARRIVADFHDAATAEREAELFDRVFRDGGLRDDIPVVALAAGDCDAGGTWLPKLLKLAGICPSTSEGRRLIEQGGVMVDDCRIDDPKTKVTPADGMLIRAGKRKAVRIQLR